MAAIAGAGILVQPLFIVSDDLQAGRLAPVLQDWSLPSLIINMAYQSRLHQPAKIRVFSDFMAARFSSSRQGSANGLKPDVDSLPH